MFFSHVLHCMAVFCVRPYNGVELTSQPSFGMMKVNIIYKLKSWGFIFNDTAYSVLPQENSIRK
jgi:hypothetical protein